MNKPKLELKRRTIARLNNVEMRHVLGGDGDEGPVSWDICVDTDKSTKSTNVGVPITLDPMKIMTTVLTKMGC